MARISKCSGGCGASVWHPASEVPTCDECSGRNAARRAEAERWSKLSVDEKLDELKGRLDRVQDHQRWQGRGGLIG